MATIDSFRTALTGGGARPSQFKVRMTFPKDLANIEATNAGVFLIKAASLPASTVQTIEVPYRGRMTKVAGERVFGNWNVTILNDTDFLIRRALETWSSRMLNHTTTDGLIEPNSYTASMFVDQLGRDDKALRSYQMFNCFPTNIGEVGLNFGDTNSIQEYQVEFSVDYWTPVDDNSVI